MTNENSFPSATLPSALALFQEAFLLFKKRWQVFLGKEEKEHQFIDKFFGRCNIKFSFK